MGVQIGADGLFVDGLYVTITSNQNDFSPAGLANASVLVIDNPTGTALDITGIDAGGGGAAMRGRVLWVVMINGAINLRHNSGSSSAANRFIGTVANDPLLGSTGAGNRVVGLMHDTNNWLQFSGS